MLQIGYKASAEQFGPGPLADYVVLAEELGFEAVGSEGSADVSDRVFDVEGGKAALKDGWHYARRSSRMPGGAREPTMTRGRCDANKDVHFEESECS